MAKLAVLKEVKVTIRMEPDVEIVASDEACAVAELMKMSADKVDEVRMAVIEACINAIEHSHAKDSKVWVDISVFGKEVPETLEIVVRDHGIGFDPENLVQPVLEEKIKSHNKRGWGLRIIEGLMDSVSVQSSEQGTVVTMRKAW